MNCADHSQVLVSLLRTAGIPVVFAHASCQFRAIYHYWAAAYIGPIIHSYYNYNNSGWRSPSFKSLKLAIGPHNGTNVIIKDEKS